MIPVLSLWLPILLSAVAVFVMSSLIHMVLTYHRTDFGPVPSEDEVMGALRRADVTPGEYMIPYAADPAARKDPAFLEKLNRGPVALLTVMESGPPSMGKNLVQWFIYSGVVGVFAAYIAGRALGPGAAFGEVVRFAGTTAFAGYALAHWQHAIWYQRPWSTTLKETFDGLLYGVATGLVFGWLWPV